MIKHTLLAATAVAALAVAAPAAAQSFSAPTVEASVGYTHYSIDAGDDAGLGDLDVDFGAVHGRLTGRLHPNFGVEGEVQVGVNDDEQTFAGTDVSIGINYAATAFVVGYVPVTPNFDLFARLGVGVLEVEAEVEGFDSESESGSTLAYGAGAQYFFDGQNGVRADYTRYDGEDDSGEADSLSVSYVRRF